MLKLIAFAKQNLKTIAHELDLDSNRKKSPNMILASSVVKDLLGQVQELKLETLDVIFCTGEGEIQQTYEFFKNLADGRARPILFQNSLHNSTLGSLSLEVPGIASGMSLSNGDISFEMAIDVALSSPSTHAILILGVDAYNDEVKKIRSESYGDQIEIISGGCAGLFLPNSHPLFSTTPGPIINDIQFEESEQMPHLENYYPANGMEAIYLKLQNQEKSFSLLRPHSKVTVSTYAL